MGSDKNSGLGSSGCNDAGFLPVGPEATQEDPDRTEVTPVPSPTPAAVSARTLRVMIIAAVCLLLAGAFAAFAHDGDGEAATTLERTASDEAGTEPDEADDPDPTGSSTSTTVPTTGAAVAEEAAPATGAHDGPAETAAPSTTEAAAATPSGAEEAAPNGDDGRGPGPVPPGRYEYATDGTTSINGDEKRLPETTSMTAPEVGADGRQTTTRDMRDANGDGSVTETTMRFTPDGVYLEGLKSTVFLNHGTFNQSTTLAPTSPFLLVPADAGPGTKTTGTLTGDGITADITFEILSVEADTARSRLVADLSGDVEGRQTSDLTTRLDDLLTLEEVSESDVRSGPVRVQSNYTATLR